MYIVFDTETNKMMDFDRPAEADDNARLVEMAAILVDGDFEELGSYSLIVNCPAPFDQSAVDIHGITPEVSRYYGVNLGAAIAPIYAWLRIPKITLVAHNMNYDWRVLRGELVRMGREVPEVDQYCTMRKSVGYCKIPKKQGQGLKFPKLSEAYEYFTKEAFDNAHTGLADARACLEVVKGIKARERVQESIKEADNSAEAFS